MNKIISKPSNISFGSSKNNKSSVKEQISHSKYSSSNYNNHFNQEKLLETKTKQKFQISDIFFVKKPVDQVNVKKQNDSQNVIKFFH